MAAPPRAARTFGPGARARIREPRARDARVVVAFPPCPVPSLGGVFSPDVAVLKLVPGPGASRLDLTSTLAVTRGFRAAILCHAAGLPLHLQSLLSGHDPGGGPLQVPHLAIFPLAAVGAVGGPRPDGRISELGIALPATTSEQDRRRVLHTVLRIRCLLLGRLGTWNVVPRGNFAGDGGLQAWTAYPGGALRWSTVTPVVYDVHPRAPAAAAAESRGLAAMIARACAHAGLPPPCEVVASQQAAHSGAPPSHAYPGLRRKDGSRRCHTHLVLAFDHPVRGPVLLGAGRYRGYGLLRPLCGPGGRAPAAPSFRWERA